MSTTAWLLLALVVAVLFGLAFVVKALLWVAIIAAAVWVAGLGLGWLWAAIAVLVVVRAYGLVRRWRQDTWLVTGV